MKFENPIMNISMFDMEKVGTTEPINSSDAMARAGQEADAQIAVLNAGGKSTAKIRIEF